MFLTSASAAGAASLLGLTETGCDDLTAANADYEAYGPTDVNAQAGDGNVTVGENAAGTITVFKWPNPSFYNQVKYVAVGRDAGGRAIAEFPNEGAFEAIRYVADGRSGFAWLRDWPSEQRYDSTDSAVPVTVYRSPPGLGLTVTTFDLAQGNALEREIWIARTRNSRVSSAALVAFENFNPIASRLPLLPLADWCLNQLSDQRARYDDGLHAIVNSWNGLDAATGHPSSVAVAVGFDRPDSEHQVGNDHYVPIDLGLGPADAYDQARLPPYRLAGASSADGQTDGALALPLAFDRRGQASARLNIAAGDSAASAGAALAQARATSFTSALRSDRHAWHAWLARTRLPATVNRRVVSVAKRSLISLRLAMVRDSGAIVASADTQGPYGEDWIRDGAFMNEALDANGYTADVTRHNLFYARVQTSLTNPSALRPPGNWPMASYGDGVDGAPVPWEIDETGLGVWTLFRHASFLSGKAARDYLLRVYPAIKRAADFLVICQDPTTGLQCPASEDDNFTPSQSLHGAETTVLAMTSAIAAADAVGDRSSDVTRWRTRLTSIRAAIEKLYDPQRRAYGEGNTAGNAYDTDYEDGGWLLWPVVLKPYSDQSMLGEADDVFKTLDASLAAANGEYESRGLLGLAHAWKRPTRTQAAGMQRVLTYMATSLTTPTGLFGEAWRRYADHRPQPVEDMPHVWEHTLFYLAAVQIDGARSYSFQHADAYHRACVAGTAPRVAC